MVVLWAFSVSLEEGLGKCTLVGFYVLFGVVGGLAHAATNWSDEIPLVGASGAIAGLIGAYTVLYGPMSKIRTAIFLGVQPLIVQVPAAMFGFGWLMLQLYEAGNDPDGASGVAWYAHIGGFLAGAVTMYICRGDVACEVKEGSHGYLEFEHQAQPQAAAAPPAPSAVEEESFSELPTTCPYCEAALGEEHQQGENLIRCGNDECGRLIFLQAAAWAPTA